MAIRPVRFAILAAALAAALAASQPALAQPDRDDETPAHLAGLLVPSLHKTISDCGLLTTRQLFLDSFAESETTFFLGFSASLLILDGSPNVDSNEYGENALTDAFNKTGVCGMVSLDIRMLSSIYLRSEVGVAMFSSGGAITDNINRRYELESMSMLIAAIGGTYSYPVLMLGDNPDKATDLDGLQLVARCTIGIRYLMDTRAQVEEDPTGEFAEGDKFPFWHDTVGAYFRFVLGAEFRVDIFTAFVEFGAVVFEEPRSATHPRDYANSDVVVCYPITVGFSMRF